ncbi:hypothetical protein HAHI6034_10885 [Hathewaya histolytica]|uniref:Uncharacterized protein n=1 Tax=Hathewaya histolytica TaxID=1498 RepID=A0A4V6KD36_HATHI|nr:hypothetical protein [Hathewaya histolytica]VTQ88747.1 Uncharacterised protein [Hathewaya histolytica]
MSDGCKIETKGIEEAIGNLKRFTSKLRAALFLDAQNIAANMERWAKANAKWIDRTSDARQFLKATVQWKNSNELMIAMSHHVDYGVYLELCNEGRYAILEQAIQEFAPEFKKGWKQIVQSAGGI